MFKMASNVSVPNYLSESEEDLETHASSATQSQRRAKRTRDLMIEKTFTSRKDALDFINREDTWSYHYKNTSEDGNKHYYRCNKAKRRTTQCPAGVYLLYNCNNENVVLYRTSNHHEHTNLETNRLSTQLKAEIERLYELKIEPKTILSKLRESGIQIKNKAQISNYIVQLRKKNMGLRKLVLDRSNNGASITAQFQMMIIKVTWQVFM